MSSSKEAEYSEMLTISSASAAIDKADEVEAATAANVNAVRRLTERIKKWNTRTLENSDDIKTTFSFTDAGGLEKKAYALLGEYNALVADHEKLFARCYSYTDGIGVTRYVYIYPTEELWMGRPGNSELLYEIFRKAYDAVNDAKFAGYIETKAKLNQIMIGFYDVGTLHCGSAHCGSVQRYYRGPDRLPQSAVPCPEHVVEKDTKQGCTLQGGSKKSKSKYSRKMKSKYSRKSKSKYLRKSKSKFKSKYSRKY